MITYCLTCQADREIKDPIACYSEAGFPITTGECPVCGRKLMKRGKTEAHAGLSKTAQVKTVSPTVKPEEDALKEEQPKAKKPGAQSKLKTRVTSKQKKSSPQKNLDLPEDAGPIIIENPTGKPLVIVESPAKARTIGRFLGDDYHVIASVGHIRDLRKNQLSIDIENNFKPSYQVPVEKRALVSQITETAAHSIKTYLATDPDREGESIAWHLADAARINPKRIERVVFHEITRDAVAKAFANPRQIDMDLVDAQQARRVLDRLVGYGLSPVLWEKVRGQLSAGRVQSVALRLIVEREREISAFVPVEFWNIHALFNPENCDQVYRAKLVKINGEEPNLVNSEHADRVVTAMRNGTYAITRIGKSRKKQNPSAPFITSTMQQEASRKLNFLIKRTMAIAQQLYEGIDLGKGEQTGLITYMRTDSVHVAAQAVQEARAFISKKYGDGFLPEKPPAYKTKSTSAQEAHEAIRPTSVMLEPESIKHYLTPEQFKLYRLIWQRFVASQMEAAVIETTTVGIQNNERGDTYLLKASDQRVIFQGYRMIYQETEDEGNTEENVYQDLPLDFMAEGQHQILRDLEPSQHFTQPPAHFTEATLIQELEKNEIGRPSTYSPIISNIQSRGYVRREMKRLEPTEIGYVVNDLLVEYFPEIVDVGFTSEMEKKLDKVADGKMPWVKVIEEFYGPFAASLAHAKENMPKTPILPEKLGRPCPKCGNELVLRTGRYGKFISCSTYPTCTYREKALVKLDIACPKCGSGEIVERSTRKGRKFYGCSRYPDCDFSSWNRPIKTPCPDCGGLLVSINKEQVRCMACQAVFSAKELETTEE